MIMRQGWIFIGMAAILAGGLCGCLKQKEVAADERPPAAVQTASAIQTNVPMILQAFGRVVAVENVDVMPQVSGKLLEIHFKDGATVKAGDKLFTIDPREYKASLDKAEATLAADQAGLKMKKATLERNAKLIEKNLISKEDFEKVQADFDASDAQVRLDKAAVDLAAINLEYCSIVAPTDGHAGKRLVDAGNLVQAGSTKLVNLRKLDSLYVDFSVSEEQLSLIRNAMNKGTLDVDFMPERELRQVQKLSETRGATGVDASLREYEEKGYDAQLVFLDNTVSDTTGAIALRAIVTERMEELWPGQFVRVGLTVETRSNAVIVPANAVQSGKNGPYVFVVKPDQTADYRMVKQAFPWASYIVIDKGVQAGELVVLLGQMGLYPGAKVFEMPDGGMQAMTGKDAKARNADAEKTKKTSDNED